MRGAAFVLSVQVFAIRDVFPPPVYFLRVREIKVRAISSDVSANFSRPLLRSNHRHSGYASPIAPLHFPWDTKIPAEKRRKPFCPPETDRFRPLVEHMSSRVLLATDSLLLML